MSAVQAAAVELSKLRVSVAGRVVLDDLSLTLGPEERVAIVGKNGVGKSTLLNVLLGIRSPASGSLLLHGQAPPASGVGFVPQDPGASLLPWFRLRDNILLPLRARGASEAEQASALAQVVSLLDPRGTLDLDGYPGVLSGGQRQLTALMRGLVGQPRLLLCDEPFSALDAPTRARLRGYLAHACDRPNGPALVLITHDLDGLDGLVSKILVLAGRPARITRELDPAADLPGSSLEALLSDE